MKLAMVAAEYTSGEAHQLCGNMVRDARALSVARVTHSPVLPHRRRCPVPPGQPPRALGTT